MFWALAIAFEALLISVLCWFISSRLTSEFVKSFWFSSVPFHGEPAPGPYGNGTVDVSWFT